jgi:hypothetical protein
MKTLFIFLTLLSLNSFACNNPIKVSEAEKAILGQPSKAHDCNISEQDCICYDNAEWEAAEIVDEFVNGAAIYTVNSQAACTDEADCVTKMQALVCDEGFTAAYRLDTLQAYCYRLDGYEQVNTGKKKLQNNPTKLSALQAKRAAEATLAAIEAQGVKAKADCERVLNLIRGFNLQPGRTSEQTDAMSTAFAEIKAALEDGRPGKAKTLIQAATPDGTIVTQGMKDAALSILKDW